ncbi:MAG: N-acetyltransferase family protein [Bacteroidia bacterium]
MNYNPKLRSLFLLFVWVSTSNCKITLQTQVSVYVSCKYRGRKIGTQLLETLILESEKEKFWALQAGIFPENIPSIKIHEQLSFRKIGHREKIGKMNGVWRDTLLLERRSKKIGIE